MSQIYSMAIKTCRRIESEIKGMLLYNIFLKILLSVEKIWLDSYFRKAYPSGKFLKFLEKSHVLKNHIFAPPLFILAFSIFMIMASTPVSWKLHLTILIGFIFFFLFSMIIPRFILKDMEYYLKFKSEDINSIGLTLFLVSIIFFIITITDVGGLPLLHPTLRYSLNPKLTIPAFLMIPATALISSHLLEKMKEGSIDRARVKFRIMVLALICAAFLTLLGYRTPVVALILIIAIMGYYTGLFDIWEILGSFLFAFLVIMGIGYFRSVEEYSVTSISAMNFLKMRAAFTLNVLDMLSHLSGPTGALHGDLIMSMIPGPGDGPRTLIGKLISWRTGVTITPTIFGQMLVDFGTAGVAAGMGILGLITGAGYRIMKKTGDTFYIMLYALIMAYLIISVETGILDQTVMGYFAAGGAIYLYNIVKINRH